jgi:hypothetical protein
MLKIIVFMFLLGAQYILICNDLTLIDPEWWMLTGCLVAYDLFRGIDKYV